MSKLKQLNIMAMSGEPARLHAAFLTATTGAASGRRVCIFFTSEAVRLLVKGEWENMSASDTGSGADLDKRLGEMSVPDGSMLMDAISAMNVRLIACEISLKSAGIQPEALDRWPLIELGSAADFLDQGTGGDYLSF